ncbi:polysaccharide deacetylase family protein [filamentous cyanobacterium LEGE 11480]|uniref:Polysaccharide deacetylase family protein n=1 Tax=Romeriopsis navalis LEGE 11480 TaxID=2777977 RepID=A0A928VME1_9CYAN|nr:polysaccharide deacetylase family protein [Romeriopsis navalis]MBE9030282.1 polysaccharide deacetylase family protein [Romeriopsis navalis LEGE 11480]
MRQIASISLDLDNKWSYLRAQGVEGWEQFPSYFSLVVPKILAIADQCRLALTVFVVGRDAEIADNVPWLQQIVAAGHDIGNHSYMHEPWMQENPIEEIEIELHKAAKAIESATGQKTNSFRGPGFAVSTNLLTVLQDQGYVYDASVFPTFLGSILRKAALERAEVPDAIKNAPNPEFGRFGDGFRSVTPHRWSVNGGSILEIPVTTMPVFRVPIHLTYLHFLASKSKLLAKLYLWFALTMCKIFRVEPSILLHPLDFIAADTVPELGHFPGMGGSTEEKCALTIEFLQQIQKGFKLMSLSEYATLVQHRQRLKVMTP